MKSVVAISVLAGLSVVPGASASENWTFLGKEGAEKVYIGSEATIEGNLITLWSKSEVDKPEPGEVAVRKWLAEFDCKEWTIRVLQHETYLTSGELFRKDNSADTAGPPLYPINAKQITWACNKLKTQAQANDNRVAASKKNGNVIEIRLRKEGGVFFVPIKIDGLPEIPFVVDSGASEIALTDDIFRVLIRTGAIKKADFLKHGQMSIADGTVVNVRRIRVHTVEIGGRSIEGLEAVILPSTATAPLLGQNFFKRVEPWNIDTGRGVLTFSAK